MTYFVSAYQRPVSLWLMLLCVAAKQAAKEPDDDDPERAKRQWCGGDGFCFRFSGFVRRLRLLRFFSNFQVLFHARRELAEHLPRYFLIMPRPNWTIFPTRSMSALTTTSEPPLARGETVLSIETFVDPEPPTSRASPTMRT